MNASDRCTGKTTKLIAQAGLLVKGGNHVLFLVKNQQLKRVILERFSAASTARLHLSSRPNPGSIRFSTPEEELRGLTFTHVLIDNSIDTTVVELLKIKFAYLVRQHPITSTQGEKSHVHRVISSR